MAEDNSESLFSYLVKPLVTAYNGFMEAVGIPQYRTIKGTDRRSQFYRQQANERAPTLPPSLRVTRHLSTQSATVGEPLLERDIARNNLIQCHTPERPEKDFSRASHDQSNKSGLSRKGRRNKANRKSFIDNNSIPVDLFDLASALLTPVNEHADLEEEIQNDDNAGFDLDLGNQLDKEIDSKDQGNHGIRSPVTVNRNDRGGNTAEKMDTPSIFELLHEGKQACEKNNTSAARQLAVQAETIAKEWKGKLLTGIAGPHVTEDDLAVWFGDCAFIFHSIEDFIPATRCFYTATIFDKQWTRDEHLRVSGLLWEANIFLKTTHQLRNEYKELSKFLLEIDGLAKLAEKRGKWDKCMQITNDVQGLFEFLSNTHGIGARDRKDLPTSNIGIRRCARCAFKMGNHELVKRLCAIILDAYSEYDDVEAYKLWAKSLLATNDSHLALKKCELALQSCKDDDEDEMQELRHLHVDISQIITQQPESKDPDEEWITGTLAKNVEEKNKKTVTKSKKKRHRRPKAINPAPDLNDIVIRAKVTKEDTKRISADRNQTDANSSKEPPSNTETKQSESEQKAKIGDKIQLTEGLSNQANLSDCDVSDTDSDDDIYSVTFEKPNFEMEPVLDDDTTFYEQSCRAHLSEHAEEAVENEQFKNELIQSGVKLNIEFMHTFEDRHPDVLQRDQFYNNLLPVEKLREHLLQHPDIYKRCIIQIEGSHAAYCTPVDGNEEMSMIEISGRSKAGQTFDEDEVVVKLLDIKHEKQEKRYGEVIGIWERHRHKNIKHPVFICTLDDMESHLVRPMCKTVPKIHILNREVMKRFKARKKYKLEIYDFDEQAERLEFKNIIDVNPSTRNEFVFLVAYINWSPLHIYPRGAVIKVLPYGNSIDKGLSILNLQHEVPALYSKETTSYAEGLIRRQTNEPVDYELRGRTNLTNMVTFTIDPEGSKDLDDALSIEQIPNGYKVGVHIADVSSFVQKDDPIDIEAKRRAVTYYPGIRRPRTMLPEPFSNKFCSLLPDIVRKTVSIFLYLTTNGKPMQMEGNAYEIVLSYIKSKRQYTYKEIQDIIEEANNGDQHATEIKQLYRLAFEIRKQRLGNSMFAVDLDECDSFDETLNDCIKAHYLVEEFMVMANAKVARVLCRKYPECVPLRCQLPPCKEDIDHFIKEHGPMIDAVVSLQDKNICDHKKPTFENLLREPSFDISVMKRTWETIRKLGESASKCIRMDDLHPLQHIVRHHWISIQQPAQYRCSGGGDSGQKDKKHFSLEIYPYTHFTSPIRRYTDIVIHRLIHAYKENKPCPYTKSEIDDICVQVTSQMRRSKKYERGCKALQQAIEFRNKPQMVSAFVDDISDRSITLSAPALKHVAKANREMTFSLLDMGYKPIVEPEQNPEKVTATWRKRLYSLNRSSDPPDRGDTHVLQSNPGAIQISSHIWAGFLKKACDDRLSDLDTAIKHARVSCSFGKLDVTTECINPMKLRPFTKFSMLYRPGQIVRVQMSAEPEKGIVAPKPVLYNMTENIKLCLEHMDNPVRQLYYYSTKSTLRTYPSLKEYIDRWFPLILMEAAVEAVRNEDCCIMNNVPIQFQDGKSGKFALYSDYCGERNIDFSGIEKMEDDSDDEKDTKSDSAKDWLCIKQPLPSTTKENKSLSQGGISYNVYHAHVTSVRKRKKKDKRGKLRISFTLHTRSPTVPEDARLPPNNVCSVELLRKTEICRRTEYYLKKLSSDEVLFARKIALNRKNFPVLDEKRLIICRKLPRDFRGNPKRDGRTKPLPPNNGKQQEAIDKALSSSFSLIQGPPGTGKTYTGIKLICLFNILNQEVAKQDSQRTRVFYCGPSNKSVDVVAAWMVRRLGKDCPKIVRVYGHSIECGDFPIPGKPVLQKKGRRYKLENKHVKSIALHHLIRLPDRKYSDRLRYFDKIFKETDYEPQLENVKQYNKLLREAELEEIQKYDVILCTTAVGSHPKVLEKMQVQQIIIDEAGMCTEPECLVPIIATKAKQVVLIGDHKQLRPIILCREAAELGLEKSLFERYWELCEAGECSNVACTMLDTQYRMHKRICEFPSKQFYEKKLQTARPLPWSLSGDDERVSFMWPRGTGTRFPHVLVHVEGEEKVLTVSTDEGNERSRSNAEEVKHVVKTFRFMIDAGVGPENIKVLSQYNAQCSEIDTVLSQEGFQNYTVSTVVSSQGSESDYIIFSTVRSLPDYKIEKNPTLGWCSQNLGFITDRNQINVALTRARKGLIIIGNIELLKCDYVWKRLIQHYTERGCIMKREEFPPPPKTRQQKLQDNIERSDFLYGYEKFVKGTATSFEGSFDEQAPRRQRLFNQNPYRQQQWKPKNTFVPRDNVVTEWSGDESDSDIDSVVTEQTSVFDSDSD